MAAITGNTVAIDFLKNTVSLIGGASQHSFPDLAVAVCILVVIGHNGKRFVTEFIDFCTVHLEQKWLYFHERNQCTMFKKKWNPNMKYDMEHETSVHEDQILLHGSDKLSK